MVLMYMYKKDSVQISDDHGSCCFDGTLIFPSENAACRILRKWSNEQTLDLALLECYHDYHKYMPITPTTHEWPELSPGGQDRVHRP